VFREQYSILVYALESADLYRYFVSEEIITLIEYDDISAETNLHEKAEVFLRKVYSSLEIGHAKSFYKMLEVMASYGNEATKELARKINKTLHTSVSVNNGMSI